jgi:cardiolipin synthase A/B
VRLLLDSFFDDEEGLRSNRATADYLHTLAQAEGLDLEARTGNPTGGGTHAKLYLLRVGGETWSAVGSLNGGEVSHKLNREVVLMVDHPAVYARLLEVFWWDWELRPLGHNYHERKLMAENSIFPSKIDRSRKLAKNRL